MCVTYAGRQAATKLRRTLENNVFGASRVEIPETPHYPPHSPLEIHLFVARGLVPLTPYEPHCISLRQLIQVRSGTQTTVAHDKMSELLGDLLIMVLFGTQASFTHPGIILPAKETLGDLELRAIVRKSREIKDDRLVQY